MALKPCPECKKLVSDKAKTCPHCGVAQPHGRPRPAYYLVPPVFLLTAVVALYGKCPILAGICVLVAIGSFVFGNPRH
jgi:hypothetical protein